MVAHKQSGNVLVYLTESSGAYFLSFGEIVNGKNGAQFKLVGQKILTVEQVHHVLATVFNNSPERTSSETQETILLEVAKNLNVEYAELVNAVSKESPYFDTKNIFLSVQKTRGPNLN